MAQPYPLAREFHGIRYTLLAPPESNQARFAFTGRRPPWMAEVRSAKPSVNEASFTGQTQEQLFRFQNQEIVWDTTLITLAHYHAEQPKSAQPTVRTGFLEIGGETAHGRAIRVALDIPVIDEAAILRTIIMLRNYKRLHPGRHEFGIPHTFPPYTAV
jgi:hypothetical protein